MIILIKMGRIFKKVIWVFCTLLFLFSTRASFAMERIGIITDTLLTPVNYYNAYYRTPEFFAQDIRSELYAKGVQVVPYDTTQKALKNAYLTQNDLIGLQTLSQGYNLEYPLLKKIAKAIGVKKLVIVTMGMETQRDFLKNTAWNILNVPGFDVVNPTHRVSVYCALVDTERELVYWESIYAKNIRNNKMKNLDTTISGNYEGMLRLKEYSRYISPDIAYNVKMKMINMYNVEPATYITRENIKQYAKDRHNIGVKKELSEIDRQKWDTEKLTNDTKENIKEFAQNTKEKTIKATNATKKGAKKAYNATKDGAKKATEKTKKGFQNFFSKFKKDDDITF